MTTTTYVTPGQQLRRTRTAAAPPARVGPSDQLSMDDVVTLVPQLPIWDDVPRRCRNRRLQAVSTILDWLHGHPGDGWQERWMSAGADRNTRWLNDLVAADPRSAETKRAEMIYGLAYLLLCRVVLPSYEFLAGYRAKLLYSWTRKVLQPDLFARMEQVALDQGMQGSQITDGLRAVSKMVLHTGRDVDRLTTDDVYEYRESFYKGLKASEHGVHAAWDMLQGIGLLPADVSLRDSLRHGQRTTAELVDRYQLRCGPVRDVLIRYLDERRPGLDYGSLKGNANTLAGLFWADIERHHPDQTTLRLPREAAEAWKQRLRTITTTNGEVKPRRNYLNALARVRSFYLDIQEWAMEDPTWASWAAPSPVRRGDLAGMGKARKRAVAEMHQRVRERLPQLSLLVDSLEDHRATQATLLAAAQSVHIGQTFEHSGQTYLRTNFKSYIRQPALQRAANVVIENLTNGERIDVAEAEDDAFWSWAIVETLRHTGVRIEELLEITHLALVSYRLPDTGEVVPLLQIVPSKSNEERLLLVSPELASALAAVVRRLRDSNDGTIPLVARYDSHEKTTGPRLPHLFQRKNAWRPSVVSMSVVKRMLTDAIARAGILDRQGNPLHYTPHDFRRMFATDAVTGGLPVHIAAKLLGHHDLATTQSYLAVFQDELIRTYRAFLDRRRAARPEAEYREPTAEEWHEFEQHFQQRKLELGTCGRPYGSPCNHEHACIRCPMLRVDPRQRPRLAEIAQNLQERIAEAGMNGWLGEVQGLQVSLDAARSKLTSLDRTLSRTIADGRIDLGVPVVSPRPKADRRLEDVHP